MDLLDEYNKQEIDTLIENDEDNAYFLLELLSSGTCCICEAANWCVDAGCYCGESAMCGSCNCCAGFCTNCYCCSSSCT